MPLKTKVEYKEKGKNIFQRKVFNFKKMNYKKNKDVYEILMTPIHSIGYSERKPIIKKGGFVIETTQTYWPQYIDKDTAKPFRYPFRPDCDISDFACGFYEILYKYILNDNKLVEDNGNFVDKNFAGDTMTSVSKLPKLKEKYHCLANFWLLPMDIGRTSKNKWCKISQDNNVEDFMDRFLLLLKYNFEAYKGMYKEYFENIKTFDQFAELHFLRGSYVDEKYDIREYSEILDKTTTDTIYDFIKNRAKAISESKYAEELWEYFFKNGLLGYTETYLEPDKYPLNKEIHPYAYECTICNSIIANDENYSIPPVCDECSKRE